MNLYFLFPNVFLLGKQEHSHAIYSSLYSIRKTASRERVIVIPGFIRQHHFQTRKQFLCFIKMIWPSFKGLQCVSPHIVPHENMSKVAKNFARNFLDHFATWALLHWPSLSHGTVGCWSSILCCCPHPTDATAAIRVILLARAGWTGRVGELLGKDIKIIFRDLIPSVVLPKLTLSWLNIAIALSSSGWRSLRLIAAGLKWIIHSLLPVLKRGKIIWLMILWRIKEIAYKIGTHCWSLLNI